MAGSHYEGLLKLRDSGEITGNRREVLRLLQRAGGPVTEELMRYHLYRRFGDPEPRNVYDTITHIRVITGLGVVSRGDAGWALAPVLNEAWCRPEIWEDAAWGGSNV